MKILIHKKETLKYLESFHYILVRSNEASFTFALFRNTSATSGFAIISTYLDRKENRYKTMCTNDV